MRMYKNIEEMGYKINTDYENVSIGFKGTVAFVTEEPYKEQPHKYILAYFRTNTMKPVYNDHLNVYFSAFQISSRWTLAT